MRGVRVGQCGTDTEIVADTANIRKTNRVNWQLPPERAGDTGIYRGVMRGPGTGGSGDTAAKNQETTCHLLRASPHTAPPRPAARKVWERVQETLHRYCRYLILFPWVIRIGRKNLLSVDQFNTVCYLNEEGNLKYLTADEVV